MGAQGGNETHMAGHVSLLSAFSLFPLSLRSRRHRIPPTRPPPNTPSLSSLARCARQAQTYAVVGPRLPAVQAPSLELAARLEPRSYSRCSSCPAPEFPQGHTAPAARPTASTVMMAERPEKGGRWERERACQIGPIALWRPCQRNRLSKPPDDQIWTVMRVGWSKISELPVWLSKPNWGDSWMAKNRLFRLYFVWLHISIRVNCIVGTQTWREGAVRYIIFQIALLDTTTCGMWVHICHRDDTWKKNAKCI